MGAAPDQPLSVLEYLATRLHVTLPGETVGHTSEASQKQKSRAERQQSLPAQLRHLVQPARSQRGLTGAPGRQQENCCQEGALTAIAVHVYAAAAEHLLSPQLHQQVLCWLFISHSGWQALS